MSEMSSLAATAERQSAQYAANAALQTWIILQLLQILHLRVGGFYLIYNEEKSSPPAPLHFMAEGRKYKFSYEQFTTGGQRRGYLLEEHFVTFPRGWR